MTGKWFDGIFKCCVHVRFVCLKEGNTIPDIFDREAELFTCVWYCRDTVGILPNEGEKREASLIEILVV